MKRRVFDDVFRRLHRFFPDYRLGGGSLYLLPVSPILRGFVGTAFTKNQRKIEVAAFARPTYIPPNAISLVSFSKSARRGALSLRTSWTVEELNREEAIQVLAVRMKACGRLLHRLSSPLAFARCASWYFGPGQPDIATMATGLSLARAGRFPAATAMLEKLQKRAVDRFVPSGVTEAATELLSTLGRGQPSLVQALMDEWEAATLRELASGEFRIDATLGSLPEEDDSVPR